MAITIGSNIASHKAQRGLATSGKELDKVFERLSSGQRINRASDDAAGLVVADKLNLNRRVFNQGVRNLNDGFSLLNIADSAVNQLSSIVERLRELATQAASGSLGYTQRKALNAEAQELREEYFRISRTTKFNGRSLFNGELQELRLQGGFGSDGGIASGLGGSLGTGTFTNIGSYSVASSSGFEGKGQDVGDINNDGNLDFLNVSYTDSMEIGIKFGTGDGSFFYSPVNKTSSLLTVGNALLRDVNGDGNLDILISGSTSQIQPSGDGIVEIFFGNGDGTFADAVSFDSGTVNLTELEVADINSDGKLDLIATGYFGPDSMNLTGAVYVLLGNGNGTFQTSVSYTVGGANPRDLAIGDLNGDGIPDIVTVGDKVTGTSSTRAVLLGNGDGTFGAAVSTDSTDDYTMGIVLNDINGDGILDMLTSGSDNSGAGWVNVYFGSGNGTFVQQTGYANGGTIAYDVVLEDINGDGIQDLITAGTTGGGKATGRTTVRLGNGDGTFGAATSYITHSSTAYTEKLSVGDFNNDGVVDILALGYSGFLDYSVVLTSNTQNGVAPLLEIDLTSIADAKQAISDLTHKATQLSKQRGTIGAFQSRLSSATSVLYAQSDNYAAAEARIRDIDVAKESADLTRLSILRDAAAAVLGQANQQPQIALQLLGGVSPGNGRSG